MPAWTAGEDPALSIVCGVSALRAARPTLCVNKQPATTFLLLAAAARPCTGGVAAGTHRPGAHVSLMCNIIFCRGL